MAEMDEFLENWLKKVKAISIDLTPKDQEKITAEGGKVFEEKLTQITRQKHYSNHDDKKYGHAADHIAVMNSDVDGDHNGAVTVDWDDVLYMRAFHRERVSTRHSLEIGRAHV